MGSNHFTAARITDMLIAKNIPFEHKRMFGGDCFMVDDKILMGTYKGGLMARVDPQKKRPSLKSPAPRP